MDNLELCVYSTRGIFTTVNLDLYCTVLVFLASIDLARKREKSTRSPYLNRRSIYQSASTKVVPPLVLLGSDCSWNVQLLLVNCESALRMLLAALSSSAFHLPTIGPSLSHLYWDSQDT